jgi:hypothetical protein
MCMTQMSTFEPDETITITPLRTFPVIRDLVTDVSLSRQGLGMPSFTPPADLAPGDYRMAQADLGRSQEFRKCIECFLCQDVCHVIRDHDDNKPAYAGPRLFIRLAELEMHPLDTADRRRQAREEHDLGLCNVTKCCTECPEHRQCDHPHEGARRRPDLRPPGVARPQDPPPPEDLNRAAADCHLRGAADRSLCCRSNGVLPLLETRDHVRLLAADVHSATVGCGGAPARDVDGALVDIQVTRGRRRRLPCCSKAAASADGTGG